jgi:glutamate synthase domain-containing protein 1
MITRESVEAILRSRGQLRPNWARSIADRGQEAEGGCGVIGIACSEQIAGRHLLQALDQMRNRGNGKGGGIAAVGLVAEQLGVSQAVLEEDYLLAIAYMDNASRREVEQRYLQTTFDIDHVREAPHLADYRSLTGLDVEPPAVVQYFVRVREDQYETFKQAHRLDVPRRRIEDEIVYQNSAYLNGEFYASTGDKRAFVLSHGKNLLVMKMVGYGDDVVRYYRLEDLKAQVWIGHHRYPTKGRVWPTPSWG